ncbi:MAG TPA: putative Ig domain-containing protein [Verrucomicrobiae bacterium]
MEITLACEIFGAEQFRVFMQMVCALLLTKIGIMRKFLRPAPFFMVALSLLVLGSPTQAAPALVDVVKAQTGSQVTSFRVTQTVAEGNSLIVVLACSTAGITWTVTSPAGAFRQDCYKSGGNIQDAISIWSSGKLPAGSHTITIGVSATEYVRYAVMEWSGIANDNRVIASSSNSGLTQSITTGNVTTSTPDTLLFAAVRTDGDETAHGNIGAGSNFSLVYPYSSNEPEQKLMCEYRVVSSGTYGGSFTMQSSDSGGWVAGIVAYAPSGGVPVATAPLITSGSSVSGVVGQQVSYQITANNSPTSFSATPLPSGLTLNSSSGLITGIAQTAGNFNVTVSASNASGTGSASVAFNISPQNAPVISVTPSTLIFTETGVGRSSDSEVTIRNSGSSTLNGSATLAAPFSVVGSSTYSLAPGESSILTFRYTPTAVGTQTRSISFSGGQPATLQAQGTGFPVFSGWSFDSAAGLISSPFSTNTGSLQQDVVTSGDPVSSGAGRAVYGFTLTNSASILISALVNAPDAGSDSFYVNIDAEPVDPTMIWDIPATVGFEKRTVSWRENDSSSGGSAPKTFVLGKGEHKLIIRGREAGVSLGRIEITLAGVAPIPPSNVHLVFE